MKIKRILLFLIVLFIPLIISAKEAPIKLEKISIKEQSEGAIINKEPEVEGLNIVSDIKFSAEGDYVKYIIIAKNYGDQKYNIDLRESNKESDYIKYEYTSDKSIIKPNETMEIVLTITYNKEVPLQELDTETNKYTEKKNVALPIVITDEKGKVLKYETSGIKAIKDILNPNTRGGITLIVIVNILAISLIVYIVKYRKKKYLVLLLLLIPLLAIADEIISLHLTIDSNVEFVINILDKDWTKQISNEIGYGNPRIQKVVFVNNTKPEESEEEITIYDFSLAKDGGVTGWKDGDTVYINSDTKLFMPIDSSLIFSPNNTSSWITQVKSIEFEGDISTKYTSDMTAMFASDYNLIDLDLAKFDTSNTTNMASMFAGCNYLKVTSLDKFNTSKVTNMSNMFSGTNTSDVTQSENPELSSFIYQIGNWDVSNVKNMSNMFYSYKLSSIDQIKDWDVSNVESLEKTFSYSKLVDLSALKDWDVSKVKNFSNTFSYISILEDISDLENWNVSNGENFSYMLGYNKIADITPVADWDVSNAKDLSYMFYRNQLTDISTIAGWEPEEATTIKGMFSNNKLETLDSIAGIEFPKATDMSSLFYGNLLTDVSELATWDMSNVENANYMLAYNSLTDLNSATNINLSNAKTMENLFYSNYLTDISGISNWNFSNVESIKGAFSSNKLTDLSSAANIDISKVKDASYLFSSNKLTSINGISSWDFKDIENISYMFNSNQMENLDNATIDNFLEAGNVSYLFNNNKLININGASNWDLTKTTSIKGLFANNKITNINGASTWDTSNLTDVSYLFQNNKDLSNLSPITNWHITQIEGGEDNNGFKYFINGNTYEPVRERIFVEEDGDWRNGTFYPGEEKTAGVLYYLGYCNIPRKYCPVDTLVKDCFNYSTYYIYTHSNETFALTTDVNKTMEQWGRTTIISKTNVKTNAGCGCYFIETEVEVLEEDEEDDKKKKRKKRKKLKDLTYDDYVRVWNFDEGKFDWAKPLWIRKETIANKYYLLRFSNGAELKIIKEHKIYNADTNRFVSAIRSKVEFNTYTSDGKLTKLISREIINEAIEYTSVITDKHMNLFTNNILTSIRLNNLYKIDKNMTFIKHINNVDIDYYKDLPKELIKGLRLNETFDIKDYNVEEIRAFVEGISKVKK